MYFRVFSLFHKIGEKKNRKMHSSQKPCINLSVPHLLSITSFFVFSWVSRAVLFGWRTYILDRQLPNNCISWQSSTVCKHKHRQMFTCFGRQKQIVLNNKKGNKSWSKFNKFATRRHHLSYCARLWWDIVHKGTVYGCTNFLYLNLSVCKCT